MYAPRRNWDSPQPPTRRLVCPLTPVSGGGEHSLARKGLGESQFRRGAYTVVLFICTYFVHVLVCLCAAFPFEVSSSLYLNIMLDSSRLGRQVGGMADDYDSGVRVPDHSNFDNFQCCPSVIVTSSSLGKGGTRAYFLNPILHTAC